MKSTLLKKHLNEGGLEKYSCLYSDIKKQTERMIESIEKFEDRFGTDRDVYLLSAPGRSEIIGNHTDHNLGCVMAGSIDKDIIVVAAKNDRNEIRFFSDGYFESVIKIDEAKTGDESFKKFTSVALVAGMVKGFSDRGYNVGGFDAFTDSEVLKGSGLSSSAAFEVSIGNALNHLYNDGGVDNKEIAKIAQYSENVFFGKPCGLMDQMACAVGGFVYIDFEKTDSPVVKPIEFSLGDAGYSLCIVNTGGSHSDLNDDYASVPAEMKSAAAFLNASVLREIDEGEFIKNIPLMREKLGDRAVLRAMHFFAENERVEKLRAALIKKDIDEFLTVISESGASSFKFLQNVYSPSHPEEQGISLALCLTEKFLRNHKGACRVHGGGFAGTMQAFIRSDETAEYSALMESVFGEGCVSVLSVRPHGAVRLF